MTQFVKNKKILVTGARGALGEVVVQELVKLGNQVTGVISNRKGNVLSSEGDSQIHYIQADLTDVNDVHKKFSNQIFDVWVHCAGGFRFTSVEEMKNEDWTFLVNTNLSSALYLAKELIPGMKKQNFGRIVFISSRVTQKPASGMAPYAATKAGLNALTECLAEEVKSFDITVNALLPSIIDSEVNRKDMPKAQFSDWVTPKQMADIIISLVSSGGSAINGALIPVPGKL